MPRPDVVVIGGGFAGLSAAVAPRRRWRAGDWCEARPAAGGPCHRVSPIPRPANASTTGSTCSSAAITRRSPFFAGSAPMGDVALDDRLSSTSSIRRGRALATDARRRCRRRWHLLGGLAALVRPRVARSPGCACALVRRCDGCPLGVERRDARQQTAARTLDRLAGRSRADAAPAGTAVGAARRGGVEPVRLAGGPAGPFVRVLAQMFGGTPRDSAIGLPRVPLDELYARAGSRATSSSAVGVR